MRSRRSLALGAALMLVVTAVVLFVRSLESSIERTIPPPSVSSAVADTIDVGADAGAVATALASSADTVDPSRTAASKAGCALDVEIESACGRARLLDFELVPSGADHGQKLIDRDRAQWRGLDVGDYELRVSGGGWKTHREMLRVTQAAPREVVVVLEPTRFVRGRVLDRSGATPVTRFSLQIDTRRWSPAGHSEELSDWIRDLASEDGGFCVGGTREHGTELRVTASAAGFENGETDWLPVQPTEGVSDIVIELVRTVDALATVAGVVVDAETSRPIEGVDVVFVPLDFDAQTAWLVGSEMRIMETRMSMELERRPKQNRARSSSDGTFSITTLHGRQGRVLAHHAEYTLGVSATIEDASAHPPLRIELVRGTTLRGVVRTPSDGHSFHVTQIEIEGPDSHRFAALSDDLRFEVQGLTDGLHTLSVHGGESDWRPKAMPRFLTRTRVFIAGQRLLEIEIPLGLGVTGGTIDGKVESPDEPWDAQRLVGTTSEQGTLEVEQVRVVAADGAFRLTEVSAGPHWVVGVFRTTDRSRWGVGSARLDIEEGRTHGPLLLDMRRSRVAASVRLAGRPAGNARVEVVTSADDQHTFAALVGLALSITTDADGQFVVHGLPPGTYRFRREGATRIVAVEIRDGQVDYALVVDD
ncbi:MAG: hypothetical protein ACKVWV_08295 [Planctomycetota bacterium]